MTADEVSCRGKMSYAPDSPIGSPLNGGKAWHGKH